MFTPQEMRDLALDCLRWSEEEAGNACQRDIMVQLAKTWMQAAHQIDCHVVAGAAVIDLRHQLY